MNDTMQAVRACWVVSSRDWILEMKSSLLLQVTATPRISFRKLATSSTGSGAPGAGMEGTGRLSPVIQSSLKLCLQIKTHWNGTVVSRYPEYNNREYKTKVHSVM